jgi:hypothetical protein
LCFLSVFIIVHKYLLAVGNTLTLRGGAVQPVFFSYSNLHKARSGVIVMKYSSHDVSLDIEFSLYVLFVCLFFSHLKL